MRTFLLLLFTGIISSDPFTSTAEETTTTRAPKHGQTGTISDVFTRGQAEDNSESVNQNQAEETSESVTQNQAEETSELVTQNQAEETSELVTHGLTQMISHSVTDTTLKLVSDSSALQSQDSRTEQSKSETIQDSHDINVGQSWNILNALKNHKDEYRTVTSKYRHVMTTGKTRYEFLKKSNIRSHIGYIKKKTMSGSDTDGESDSETSEVDYDYDYDDEENSVYTLAHFRFELYAHVGDRLSIVNESVFGMLISMQEKIRKLENQLKENTAHTCALESKLRAAANPKRGDIRLLSNGNCGKVTRAGYLQFYTGTVWGFVCDDFFNSAASRVACNQLGFSETSSSARSTQTFSRNSEKKFPLEKSWTENFYIVLDDVQCIGDENAVASCDHYEIGKHDCSMDEVVFLSC